MKNYLVNGAIAVVVVAIGFLLYHPAPVVQQVSTDSQGNQQPLAGAVSTLNNVESGLVVINGVPTFYQNVGFAATTSVLCKAKNPFNATSTLLSFTAFNKNAAFGASITADVSTSSTAFGSSTPAFVRAHTILNTQDAFSWFPVTATTSAASLIWASAADGSTNWLIAPNDTVTLRVATATPGTLATNPSGSCHFVFESIQ